MNCKRGVVFGIAGLLLSFLMTGNAQPLTNQPQADGLVSPVIEKQIMTRLKKARPELTFSDLKSSPMPGVYKLKVNGQVAFVSQDGGHLIAGEMYEVQEGNLVNLQEQDRREAEIAFAPKRAKMLQEIKKDDMVVYSPEKEMKGYVYVFTDIDCPYCRRLHSNMKGFLEKGIEVRYLAFPRAGVTSRSAQKLVTTWCANNPPETMTEYKEGKDVTIATCQDNPIADQYMLGQQIGVTGTPAIVLESGQLIPGAVSPEYLSKAMGL